MLSAILPLVFAAVTTVTPSPAPAVASADPAPAIRVTLNHQTYNRGDRARVTVRVRDDGYVLVLHTDASGRIRVLFPVDPGDDNFMKAGQDYEIRGRGDREAFQITESGSGTVYAAVSQDAFHPDDFARNNHWDYTKLVADSASGNNDEAAMTNIVEQMADGSHFDYDLATYTAEAAYASNNRAFIVPVGGGYGCFYGSWDPWCDGYYPSPSYFSIGFGFGNPYRYGFGLGYGFPRYGFGFGDGYYGGGYYGGGYYGGGYYGGGYYGGGYYGGGYYGGGYGHGYGATGYGYSMGHGWSYNHRPVVLGPGGGYVVGNRGFGTGSIGYVNRATTARGVSPLYGVSRFNTQRVASRGNNSPADRFGRRVASGDYPGYRTRINGNTRPAPDVNRVNGGMRPEGMPARVQRPGYQSPPMRVERSGGDTRSTRVERPPEQRPQPRAEPRARAPERSPSPESHRGGGGGGGGGRRGGGGGGGRRP